MHVNISESISSYNPKMGITPCINEDTLYEHEEESIYKSKDLDEEFSSIGQTTDLTSFLISKIQ